MKRPRSIVLATVAALAATVALGGGALRDSHSAGALAAVPADARAYTALGFRLQALERETGDPVYLTRSEHALRRALALASDDRAATSGLATLALSSHHFREALALGRKMLRLSPESAQAYGVIGDAELELGRYRLAFAAFDTMARLRPGLSSYARVSYARELLGDRGGAIAAMRLALEPAAASREDTAWTRVQLGKLFWSEGRVGEAAAEYRAALAVLPGHAPALDALAQVEAARGRAEEAITLERRALEAMPMPQFAAALGDLYSSAGKPRLARAQYARVRALDRRLAANDTKIDLDVALFDVDHGIRLSQALVLARRGRAQRPSIDGDDVLAWALARNGRCAEARAYSQHALRLGTRDAVKLFHRGMIERCLGNRGAARHHLGRALALNPHFSLLWGPVARKVLR
ncbi:MAG TPA: tetratricopeptide repeat protein [Gaiellaceae bacterium]|nr:tetratricopeptide repeat protein [Gaiellaceae bacterium]